MLAYDAIVSLGGCCDAAVQLKLRNLRPVAMPFDWIGSKTYEPRILEYLSQEAFVDDFASAFVKERLERIDWVVADGQPAEGVMPYCYQDTHTGWQYIHHFKSPISTPGSFEAFANTQMRRLARMLVMLEKSRSALFLFTTGWEFDVTYADRMYEAISRRYPGRRFDLRVMQFGACREIAEPARFGGGFFCYNRKRNYYDFLGTNLEWRFLDDVRLNGWPPKPHGFDKMVYKLWKPLERYLKKRNLITHRGWN